jgi:hypothetical protein
MLTVKNGIHKQYLKLEWRPRHIVSYASNPSCYLSLVPSEVQCQSNLCQQTFKENRQQMERRSPFTWVIAYMTQMTMGLALASLSLIHTYNCVSERLRMSPSIIMPAPEHGYFVASWWRTPLRHPQKVTRFHFQQTSGINAPVGKNKRLFFIR